MHVLQLLTWHRQDPNSKSATVRRNINILRSAVMSNRIVLEELKAAEDASTGVEPDQALLDPSENEGASSEISALAAFQRDYSLAIAPPAVSRATQGVSVQIFRDYDHRQHDRPVSAVIRSLLPAPVYQTRSRASASKQSITLPRILLPEGSQEPKPDRDGSNSEQGAGSGDAVKDEMQSLLTEWTNATDTVITKCLNDASYRNAARNENGDSSHLTW